MKQFIGALATALGFWKQKAEGLRLKAVGQLSQKQLTNRLPQPASHNPDASGFAMTGEGGAVLVNGSALLYDSAPKSNNHSLTVDSALFYAAVMQKIKHWLCSRKRSGEFFIKCLLFFKGFQVFATARVWLLFLRKKKLLAFPPAMRREDYALQDYFKFKDNRKPSQKQLTGGLSQPAPHNPDASGFTMTGEGGAVLVNRSALLYDSAPKSNDHSLTVDSALFYAAVMQKIKHWLCSRKRSGEFFIKCLLFFKGFQVFATARVWLLFLRKKKLLAFPPAMRREDYGLQKNFKFKDNRKPSQKQFTRGLPQPALLNADASGFTMTGEGGAVRLNGSVSVNSSICKSNDRLLPENSALAVAVKKQKFLHFHCSNWRSGEFIQFVYCFSKAFMCSFHSGFGDFLAEKKSLALRGNEREDFNSKNNFQNGDNRKPSQKQFTRGLPQPALLNADASGFTMTGEGGAVLVNGSVSVDTCINKSNDRLLTENSALAVAVKKQKFLQFHCSNWRSGGSLLLSSYRESNSLRGNEREDYGLQNIFGSRRILFIERENGSCALGLPSLIGGTRPSPFCLDTKGTKKSRLSNLWLKQLRIGAQTEPFRYAALLQFASSPFRKCFLTPNLLRPSLRGGSAGFAESRRFRTCGEFSQKQSTQGLPQPASHNPDASGFTMTGEGGAVLVNGSVSVNSSICKSNDRLLTGNSALAVAVEKQKFLHFHCSNWRSGGFLVPFELQQKELAFRGNEREDYGLQYYFKKRFNSELSQKQSTRGLSPRSSAKVDAGLSDKSEQAITMTGEGEGVCMLKAKRLKLKALTIIIALTVVVIVGKRTNAQIKPLQIGDQVPNLMLENILNANSKQIALSDLYRKPLVLIFWNSGCRETRAQMAAINNWQSQFKGEVALVSLALENKQVVKKYLETPPLKEQFKLPTVIGDTQLSQLFPHHIHPHVVWLAKGGIVKSITAIDYLTPENVSELAKGKSLNLPQKTDRTDFKIGVNSLLQEESNQKTYYSVVKPYIPGINPAFKVWIDSSTHSIHTQVVNFPAYKIYLMAFGKFLGIPPNQVIWDVASQDKYVYHEIGGYREEWKQQSYYSYESVWPMDIPVTERLERIRTDLNAALGLNVRMETRDTTVLRLVSTGTITPSKGGKALNVMEPEKPVKLLQNAGLGVLIYEMNQQSQNPPVIDETGFKGTVDMELAFDSFTDIPQINMALASYHLKFEEVKRPILFLVFQEKNLHP